MNTNEIIKPDLFPRNVPKPSSFHENTLRPEVPEVSLMFEGGFQFNRPNDINKNILEKANKSSSKLNSESAKERGGGSPVVSDPTDYNIHEILLLKNSKQYLTPNKNKSKPSTLNKSLKTNKEDSIKSSSDETDMERKNGEENFRCVNSDNHLIEPVESYSVWKYKNQHMFVKDGGQDTQRENVHHGSPEYRNPVNEPRRGSEKPPYRPIHDQHQVEMINKVPFEQSSPDHRMEYLKYRQEHLSPNVDYANRNNAYRIEEDYVQSQRILGKSNWRTAPPMMPDISDPVARYNDAMPYQKKSSDGTNGVNELCKIVEFQTKHIEFLNEQIYTLTLQNKTLNNLSKHVKSLEDTQLEQFEYLKKNFDKLQETILSAHNDNNLGNQLPSHEIKTSVNDEVESHLERLEKKLIDIINSKMTNKTHGEAKVTTQNQIQVEDDEDETSSNEDAVQVNSKHKTRIQCKCACDSQKQPSIKSQPKEVLTKAKQKNSATKTDRRGTVRHLEQQTDLIKYNANVAQEWECPPGYSKQIISKKSNKKIQRHPDQVETLVTNPAMARAVPQPILYYQQPIYQGSKTAPNNQREKQKKEKGRSKLDQKQSDSQVKKTMKPKIQPHVKNSGGGNYRANNTQMNDEHSLTLNARELPVINEHIPSPEASVHIDMGEYQSSSSEFQDSDQENRDVSEESNEEDETEEGAPWPTFYNNVVGKVHKLLQDEEQTGDTQDEQYRTVQVRMATMDQFKKMGISFVDDSHSPNSKRVTFNKSKTKLNPQHNHYTGEAAKRSPLTAVCNTNLSFASLQYLQRYHLLPSPNIQTQEPFQLGYNVDSED